MPTELLWLMYTAVLAGSLWIPYVVGINVTEFEGKKEIFLRPPDNSKMDAWVHRAYRAHLNLLEQLLPFAIIVLIGATLKVSTPVTAWCAVIFFWLRVAHAICMIGGLSRPPVRPIIYSAAWIVMLAMAWQILSHV
jgi:uncharacterized MAPEG superfamily protein